MIELDPSLKDFLAESAENLDRLDRDFVALEQNPQDRASFGSIFRTIHTIKGTCSFFGLGKFESVTHVGENLLCQLRDGGRSHRRSSRPAANAPAESPANVYREWTATVAKRSIVPPTAPAASMIPEAAMSIATSGVRESDDGTEGNVRLNISLLDRLVTLVGKLVLARNQIRQHPAVRKGSALTRNTQRLNLITTELQEGVMKTWMQPIATV